MNLIDEITIAAHDRTRIPRPTHPNTLARFFARLSHEACAAGDLAFSIEAHRTARHWQEVAAAREDARRQLAARDVADCYEPEAFRGAE